MTKLPALSFPNLPAELAPALELLAPELGLTITADGLPVRVTLDGRGITLRRAADGIDITCGRVNEFCRALSHLAGEGDVNETGRFSMLCYMADMSRNAVYNLPTAKKMLRLLALCGYDSMMLYTEDTFELPGYPYFGHMRGRFTADELREIDDYAYALGIEVIPCIQTLAHLATALRWSELGRFSDTPEILLVGDDRTYAFIDAMLELCKSCFRSRRINIGMDEAHALGLGTYLKKNGYVPAPEIMLAHLDRVTAQCHAQGYHPMIWSDMFFRMAFGGAYRVREGEIEQSIIDRVPDGLTLIYWDYYSLDREIFAHMVDCHLKFHNPIAFAGGAWKWSGFAPHNHHSLVSTELQLDICAERGLDNIIVTAWGDNGAEASQFSILPTLLYFAERGYADTTDDAHMEARSRACFGIGYGELLTVDAPNELPGITVAAGRPLNPCKYMLYNDPMTGLLDRHFNPDADPAAFAANAERLFALADHPTFGYMFNTLGHLCRVLSRKSDLTVRMRRAYLAGDRETIRAIAEEIPGIIADLDAFIDAFRTQWETENKTFGFDVEELRLGGLKERLRSTIRRLDRWLDGTDARIEEFEQPVLTFDCRADDDARLPHLSMNNWAKNVSASVV